jgi:hypothetical protein
VLGGMTGAPFLEFRRLFREGFELARKHCDRIISEFIILPLKGSVLVLMGSRCSFGRVDAERFNFALFCVVW